MTHEVLVLGPTFYIWGFAFDLWTYMRFFPPSDDMTNSNINQMYSQWSGMYSWSQRDNVSINGMHLCLDRFISSWNLLIAINFTHFSIDINCRHPISSQQVISLKKLQQSWKRKTIPCLRVNSKWETILSPLAPKATAIVPPISGYGL